MYQLTSNRETTETPLVLEGSGLGDGGSTVHDNGVVDEAVLVTLDLADHIGLRVGRAVVVDDTKTALQSHVDGHLILSHSVHRGGDKGSLESDALGDLGVKRDGGGGEADVAGEEEEIIVGQATVLGGVHELVDVKTIEGLVLLEHLKGIEVVKDLNVSVVGHCDCVARTSQVVVEVEVVEKKKTQRKRSKRN